MNTIDLAKASTQEFAEELEKRESVEKIRLNRIRSIRLRSVKKEVFGVGSVVVLRV